MPSKGGDEGDCDGESGAREAGNGPARCPAVKLPLGLWEVVECG